MNFSFKKVFLLKIIKSKKSLIICSSIIIFLIFLSAFLITTKHNSRLYINFSEQINKSSLYAINSPAKNGRIHCEQIALFKFSDFQQNIIQQIGDEQNNASLTIRISILKNKKSTENSQNGKIKFGFLSTDDFTKKGEFIKKQHIQRINQKNSVTVKLNNSPDIFDISFAMNKNDIPKGFYVYSENECKIKRVAISSSVLGFDKSQEIQFFGFSINGGILDFNLCSFDFSGGSLIFPTKSSYQKNLPEFKIGLSSQNELKSSIDNQKSAKINFGGEFFTVENVECANSVIFPIGALKNPFSRVELNEDNSFKIVNSVLLKSVQNNQENLLPIKTEPGLILHYKTSAWRKVDYEIFEWDRFPKILIFDTKNYSVQDDFFRRLAFFVEKEGFKGKLLTNDELKGKHGYNAHDYKSESLADFFNAVQKQNFTLNKEEIELKNILLEKEILIFDEKNDFFKPNGGAIVSISQESNSWLRDRLLVHEAIHTLFFNDTEFQNFTSAIFYTMDNSSRDFLFDFFKSQPSLGYDTNDDFLMLNEFMAYLLQQKISEVGKYFVSLANRGSVIKFAPELAKYVRETKGIGFEDCAIALNDFVYGKYGVKAGNISLVKK